MTLTYKQLIQEAVEIGLISQALGKPAILSFRKLHPEHQQSIVAALISDNENVRNFIESEINADLEEELDQHMRLQEESDFEESGMTLDVFKAHSSIMDNIFKGAL